MIEIIKNQPVSFSLGDDFNTENFECTQDNVDFCQMVVPGDTTMFQMITTPLNGVNQVTGQPFDKFFTDWSSTLPGQLSYIPDGVVMSFEGSNIFQWVNVTADCIYKVEYDVVISNGAYIEFDPQNALGNVETWGTLATAPNETGRFTAYFKTDQTSINIYFRSRVSASGDNVVLNNIDVLELSCPTVTIQDSTGADVYSVTDLTYYENIIQAQFDWPSLTKGQYNICVTGIDDLSQNYIQDSLCLGLENGGGLLQENGQCIKWYG